MLSRNSSSEVDAKERSILVEEKQWLKENPQIKMGSIYFAWNKCFPDLIKIGATKRHTPYLRLKELSGTSVPESFELIACFPCSDPFKVEAHIKQHFQAQRLRKNDRYTEFFAISRDVASQYCYELSCGSILIEK